MMRLKRELDRVTEERDRARDSGKRAEQARQQLEVELKVRGGNARVCSTCSIGTKLHVLAVVLRQPTACCVIALTDLHLPRGRGIAAIVFAMVNPWCL